MKKRVFALLLAFVMLISPVLAEGQSLYRVYPSNQTVEVDGQRVFFRMYARRDYLGNLTNYVRIRDVALALSGTDARFNVTWDGSSVVTLGEDYVPDGTEGVAPFTGEQDCAMPLTVTTVGGVGVQMRALWLVDDQGGGYFYYKLRDLGEAFGFTVGWSGERGVYIETK